MDPQTGAGYGRGAGVDNIREIARAIAAVNCGAIIWAGGGDLMYAYGRDMDQLADGPNSVYNIAR